MTDAETALDRICSIVDGGEIGEPTYLRLSRRHADVDLGGDVSAMIGVATVLLGEVERVHARGQWVGERGALTLVLDHQAGAVSLIDLSSATVLPKFAAVEILLRLEGDRGTVEILSGERLRLSGPGWRREFEIQPLDLPEPGAVAQKVVERAMASAETGQSR